MSLKAVGDFARAISDRSRVGAALEHLAHLVDAEAAVFCWIETDSRSPSRIAVFDPETGTVPARLRPSVSGTLFGPSGGRLRPGSIWILSEVLEGPDRRELLARPDLMDWGIRDVVSIPLGVSEDGIHALELHFRRIFPEENRPLLASVVGTLATLWSERGVSSELERAQPRRVDALAGAARHHPEILSHENPLRLSRAEYRICQMMRDGHRAVEIAKRLDVKECTVRTHLKSIYAKAEVRDHVALTKLLFGRHGEIGAARGGRSLGGPQGHFAA